MIDRGIATSDATYWIHFFPWEPAVYWYLRAHMVKFLASSTLKTKLGFVPGANQATGNGYTPPKNLFFVTYVGLTYNVLPKVDWNQLSTDDAGDLGEMVVETLLVRGILRLPQLLVSAETSLQGQYAGRDGKGEWYAGFTYEVKTERKHSSNLYVQIAEARVADDYNAEDDFGKSINECYATIRARKAAGGKGWGE
jgi:hypothetical protein